MNAQEAHHPADIIKGLVVLVVEDQFLLAEMARDFLIEAGAAAVTTVATAAEALARLADDPSIDAAMLDLNLGGEPSYGLAQTLHARGLPFIFASGYGRGESTPTELRGVPVLDKPYTADMLLEAFTLALSPRP